MQKKIKLTILLFFLIVSLTSFIFNGCQNADQGLVDQINEDNFDYSKKIINYDELDFIEDFNTDNLEIPDGLTFGKAVNIEGETVIFFTEPGVNENEIIPDGLMINGVTINNPSDTSNSILPFNTRALSDGDVMEMTYTMNPSGSERYFNLPGDCILTGFGAGVRDSNFRSMEINYTELKYDPTTNELTFVKKGRIRAVSDGYHIERYVEINTEIQSITKQGVPCKRFEAVIGAGMRITDSNVVILTLISSLIDYDTVDDFFWHTGNEYSYVYNNSTNKYSGVVITGLEMVYWTTNINNQPYERESVITGLGFRSTDSNLEGIWYGLSKFINQM